MKITVHIAPTGEIFTFDAAAGQSFAQALWLSQETAGKISPPALCSGLGRCGRCRVRFLTHIPCPTKEDGEILRAEELDLGWRLACSHRITHRSLDTVLELPPLPPPSAGQGHSLPQGMAAPTSLALAVDLGTTSLHWCALEIPAASKEKEQEPRIIAQGQEINPQMGAGSDVMSRLAYAATPAGRQLLAERVYMRLRSIMAALPAPVHEICVAANTAMTLIMLQKDSRGLAHAPYRLSYAGGDSPPWPAMPHEDALPPLYVPPLPAPFVGGDLSAGLALLLDKYQPSYPFLLADMGTNGEFILALGPHKALLTSVPLGPALEGIGLTFGNMAGPGVISQFHLQPTGLVPARLPASSALAAEAPAAPVGADTTHKDVEPAALLPASAAFSQLVSSPLPDSALPGLSAGICGTGYLSLIHALLRAGLLNADGTFCHTPASPLGARMSSLFTEVQAQSRLQLGEGLYLTAKDVEEILKVKAAFSLALETLLQTAGLSAAHLQHIYLAGALGEHVIPADLEALGILPQGAGARLQAVGNSSLQGAMLLLTKPAWRHELSLWAKACTVLDLTAAPDFTQQYMRHMRFA